MKLACQVRHPETGAFLGYICVRKKKNTDYWISSNIVSQLGLEIVHLRRKLLPHEIALDDPNLVKEEK